MIKEGEILKLTSHLVQTQQAQCSTKMKKKIRNHCEMPAEALLSP